MTCCKREHITALIGLEPDMETNTPDVECMQATMAAAKTTTSSQFSSAVLSQRATRGGGDAKPSAIFAPG